jgi:integrase
MKDQKHLTKRRNVWFINYAVPKRHQEILGKTFIGKTTGTSDLQEAIIVRNQFLVDIDRVTSAYREKNPSPSILLNAKRVVLDQFLSSLSPEEQKEQLDIIQNRLVDKLQHRYGADTCPSNIPDTDTDKLELIAAQEASGNQALPIPDITLNDALADTLKDHDNQDTRYRFERAVRLFLDHLKRDNIKMSSISRRAVKAFITEQQETKGKSTIDGYLTCLSELWRNQVDMENIDGDNPFKGHKVKGSKQTYVPFSTKELQQVFSLINNLDDELMTLIGHYTGMRRGEIWGLRKSDIREDQGIAYFNVEPTEERGVKTINAVRRIPIHSAIKDRVLGHVKEIEDDETTLFSHRPDDDAFGKYFGRIKAKVVTDRSKTFHSLRAGFATYLEQGGIPEATAVWILGHTRNLSLSYGLYSEGPSLAQLQEAVEKAPNLLKDKSIV